MSGLGVVGTVQVVVPAGIGVGVLAGQAQVQLQVFNVYFGLPGG